MPMPWPLIVACCLGMFAATASGSTRSPFLLDIANELSVSLPAIANLFGVTSVSWGLSSYVAGHLSDRLGRRVFLIGAPVTLAFALVAMAQADDRLLVGNRRSGTISVVDVDSGRVIAERRGFYGVIRVEEATHVGAQLGIVSCARFDLPVPFVGGEVTHGQKDRLGLGVSRIVVIHPAGSRGPSS